MASYGHNSVYHSFEGENKIQFGETFVIKCHHKLKLTTENAWKQGWRLYPSINTELKSTSSLFCHEMPILLMPELSKQRNGVIFSTVRKIQIKTLKGILSLKIRFHSKTYYLNKQFVYK